MATENQPTKIPMPGWLAHGVRLDRIMHTNPDDCEEGLQEQIRRKNEDLLYLPGEVGIASGGCFTIRDGNCVAARFRRERKALIDRLVRLQKIAAGVKFRGAYGPRTQSRGRSRSTSAASRSDGAGGDSGGSGDPDPEPRLSPALRKFCAENPGFDPASGIDPANWWIAKHLPAKEAKALKKSERKAARDSRRGLDKLPEILLADAGSIDLETGAPAIATTCGIQTRIQKVCGAAGSTWNYLATWARDDRERLICSRLADGVSAREIGLEIGRTGRLVQMIAKSIREREEASRKPVQSSVSHAQVAHERPTLVLVASSPEIRPSRKPRAPRARTMRERIEAAAVQLELALGFAAGEVA